MAKIDEIKEELNYLKVWLSIIVITTISLIAWLINNYESATLLKVTSGLVGVVVLTLSVIVIDKNIKSKIKSLKDL
ncbi:MAG: hypothetical protein U9Q29_03175 [Campylobacterota bacterium]|nr:hypothetical protein [Campylobacterota bacterium]